MSNSAKTIYDFIIEHGYSVDYGLNSWSLNGWTFESQGKMSDAILDAMLTDISDDETEELRGLLYG